MAFIPELRIPDRFSPEEKTSIRKALEFAAEAHKTQTRKGGEPYIVHPASVAQRLMDEIGADAETVMTGLLHDTVEDTEVTLDDIEREFGPKLRFMVDAVTDWGLKDGRAHISDKLERARRTKEKVREYAAKDRRVLFVKIADRADNMKTVGRYTPQGQVGYSKDTLGFHVPIARELGLDAIADEMETACNGFIAKWEAYRS